MTTVKSLAIVALLVGGTSLAIAQGPPAGGYPPVARGAGGMQVAPAPHLRVSTIPPHPTTRHQRRLYAETNGTHKGRKLTPGN